MHVPVTSPARTATAATHAWTKFHTQNYHELGLYSVYEYSVYAWPYLNYCPQLTLLYCLISVTVQTTRKLPCAFQLQSTSLRVVDAALWL